MFVIGFIFCILQVSLIYYINIGEVVPNIVLALVVFISFYYSRSGYIYGFFMGTFIDLYNRHFGLNALVYTLVGYLLYKISYKFYKGVVILSLLLFLASISHQIIIHSVQRELSLYFLVRYIIPTSLYTTIVGVIIFCILRRRLVK